MTLPLVMHHGLLGLGNIQVGKLRLRYFGGQIEPSLEQAGFDVLPTRVHPTAGIAARAAQLKTQIDRQLNELGQAAGRVVILAHSMGGLDARYMVTHLGMADRVAAVVTLATPHHGSSYAEWLCAKCRPVGFVGKMISDIGLDIQGLSDLTPGAMALFNQAVPDAPDVRYFSVSCFQTAARTTPALLFSHNLIYRVEGDNDGRVSIQSARWGEHLGTWPTDHYHVINRRLSAFALRGEEEMSGRYVSLVRQVYRACNLDVPTTPAGVRVDVR